MRFVTATHPNYKAGWFHEMLCAALDQFLIDVAAGKGPKLMIEVPPRHGKSAIVSERFPVKILGMYPDWQVMLASYNQQMANKFSRKARQIARDEAIVKKCYPALGLSKDRAGVEEWETTAGGVMKAVGVGGSATGSGANIIITDDPFKGWQDAYSENYREKVWDWYNADIRTRMMPQAGEIVCNTRWHVDDLSGRLRKEGDWQIINLPALAEEDEPHRKKGEALHPERYPAHILEAIQRRNPRVFNSLYQGKPTLDEGGLLKRTWWRYYDHLPALESINMSCDMTFKNTTHADFVVLQCWGKVGADHYLIDQIRARMDFVETSNALVAFVTKHPKTSRILVEDKANGSAIISALRHKLGGILPITPKESKEARAAAVSHLIEAGNVYLPNPDNHPWVREFVEECAQFPASAHDDQVDGTTQYLNYFGIRAVSPGIFAI